MKTSLMICCYERDLRHLVFCLRSITKFATGFHEIRLLMPAQDLLAWNAFNARYHERFPPNLHVEFYPEWPGKGFSHHALKIMEADIHCPGADFIAHLDPDCVFTELTDASFYFINGKPILRYEPFTSITKRHPGVDAWRVATESALGCRIDNETMRCHPAVHPPVTYQTARKWIEDRHKMPMDEFMKARKNSFPQDFCEFVTLGNVAMMKHAELYHFGNQEQSINPDFCDTHIFQAWSHASPEETVSLWYRGIENKIRPMDIYVALGLT